MAFESVRSYVQLASGLGEMTKARAMEAAQGLLALPGADEVTRRAVQASTLADQLLEAAKSNRANLLTLVQSEVESALRKADVARVADLDAARHALTALTKEVADLRSTLAATGAAAVATAAGAAGAARKPLARAVPRAGAVTTAPRASAPSAQAPVTASNGATAPKAATKKTTAKKAATKKAATKAAAKKTTAKKTTAKKTTAKTAPAKRAVATKTTKAAE
jgi:polyhydroxyalkanoate synthesis regulator phasin